MLRWFETRIDPFARRSIVMPPSALLAFYWHFIAPIWPIFLLILFFDLLAAVSEVLLATFVAQLIDLMKGASSAAQFFSDHVGVLLWMLFVVLIARPLIALAYEVLKNQVLSPPFQTRVRWQTHGYILRQSLGFFQNDFAGRVANKLMQTAPAIRDSFLTLSDAAVFVAVQWLSAMVLFWRADPLLVIPLVAWFAAYGITLGRFIPQIRKRSTEASEARSTLLGRIVDSYTNILTVKLFAHAENEDGLRPRSARRTNRQVQVLCPAHHDNDGHPVHAEWAAHHRDDGAGGLALVGQFGLARRHCTRRDFDRAHHADVRLGLESGHYHFREHRRRTGRDGDHFATAHGRRSAGSKAARGHQGRNPLRRHWIQLWHGL